MLGPSFSHYKILSRLGAGGMGEVYRALDTQLERELAIKVAGPRFSEDPTLKQRLLSEAKTASSLNHPHICTIYEVGEVEGQGFIAMEYVAGEPLSKLIPDGGMPSELVLRYGTQISDAVDHAHEHGIIHRDLKSANVVIAADGRAKVLDFGLAKQVDEKGLEELSQTKVPITQPGSVVGTLHYLAPELLQGFSANPQSDIWSIGVLLYELSSGRHPFTGKSGYEISSAILRESPPPLPTHIPPGLRAVIQRCLSKDPSQRYHHAGEIRAALEALSSGDDLAPSILVGALVRPRRSWPLLALIVVLALVVGYLALRDRGEDEASPSLHPSGKMRLLLSSGGGLYDPTLSTDGKLLAFVAEENGQRDLYVRRVEGGQAIRLSEDSLGESAPAFSHEGDRVAFSRVGRQRRSEICVVPTFGGEIVPLVSGAVSPVWSPDDRQLAFFRRAEEGKTELVVFELEGGASRSLMYSDADLPFFTDLDWSPRGDRLAVIRGRGGMQQQLWVVPLDGGPPRRLLDDSAEIFVEAPVFTPDGEAIVYSSNRAGATNLWMKRLDESAPLQLTTGSGPDSDPSVSASGTIAFLNAKARTGLVLFDLHRGDARIVLTHNGYLWAPEFSPDGKELAFSRGEIDGSWHIWSVTLDSHRERQLTSGVLPQMLPRYLPDGQSLVYFTWSAEKDRIWRVGREGGVSSAVTPENEYDDSYADVSPDGQWVVFSRTLAEGVVCHVMPIQGGEARRLTSMRSEVPRWSPDAQWIAFSPSRDTDQGIWIVRPDGSGVRQVSSVGGWPSWWPDSSRIAFLVTNEQRRQEFWSVDLSGGESRQIGPPSATMNNPLAISGDARWLAYGDDVPVSSEIWALELQESDRSR